MRLDKVTMRGIGPFRDAVTLDMAQLGDAVLVAVCGDNGEGKSTLLEFAIPGAFYRDTPTQGSLKSRATSRDSLLEVVVTGDATYRIKHLMDATSGKGTSVVLDQAGKPIYGTTLVSDFDQWAARHLPQRDVLLASVFGAQQDAGFLGELPAGRMAILLRALGIARYERWATRANKRASECKQALEVTRARLAEARRTGGDVSLLAPAFEAAKEEAVRADAELAKARQELASLEASARAATASTAAREAHLTKQAEVRIRIDMLKAKRADLDSRIGACQQTLAREADIKSAATKTEGLRLQMEELALQRGTLASRVDAAKERERSAAAQAEQARSHSARVGRRIDELEKTLAQGAEIAQAERELPDYEAGLVTLRQGVKSAQSALDELTAATVAGAEDRIVDLRTGFAAIVKTEKLGTAQRIAKEVLGQDDAAVRKAAERPAKLRDARKAVEDCRALVTATEGRYQKATALARRAGELTAAREQIAALRAELEEHAATLRTQQALASKAAAEATSCAAGAVLLEGKHNALVAEVAALQPLAAQLPNIALARTRLEERRAQLYELRGELEPAEQMLAAIGPAPEALPPVDVEPQRAWVAGREKAAVAAHQAVAVAALRLEAARSMEEQLRALAEQQRAEEAELGDWTRLGGDLGRQGLQAAEIDSCGPELTALVNDLLHSCHGPRYTVRIDTQRLSSDGKKTLEGCQVTVIDTVRGREDEGRLFSGGERVIIGEALALGLSMLACQRSGLRGVTLVRDETGAALSPGNAEVYLRMLRRAAKQIGADRVLFVCHSPEIAELADARITVEGGKLVIAAQAGQVAA